MVLSDLAPSATSAVRKIDRRSAARGTAPARHYLTAREPWTARTGLLSAALAGVGAVVWGICWYGGSDLRTAEDQTPWLIGSIAGTVVFALAGAVWVTSGFRAVRRGMHEIARDKRAFALGGAREQADSVTHTGLVIGSGMARAHRAECLLVQGKQVRPLGPAEDGIAGCGVCLP